MLSFALLFILFCNIVSVSIHPIGTRNEIACQSIHRVATAMAKAAIRERHKSNIVKCCNYGFCGERKHTKVNFHFSVLNWKSSPQIQQFACVQERAKITAQSGDD